MPNRSGAGHAIAVLGVLSAGLALRLYNVGEQSLWFDEAFTVWAASQPIPAMIDAIVATSWDHPPLFYFVLHGWLSLLGVSDLTARGLSVIAGVAAIGLIYLLGRELFDRRAGVIAAVLLAISQFAIMYSQEARPYALLQALGLFVVYLFVLAIRHGRSGLWWAWALASIVMFFTHYYGAVLIVALGVFVTIYRRRVRIPVLPLAAAAAAGAVVLWLWLSSGVLDIMIATHVFDEDQPSWFVATPRSALSAIGVFNNGRVNGLLNSSPIWAYVVGALLITLPALLAVVREPWRERTTSDAIQPVALLALVSVLPLVAVLSLAMFLGAQYDVRYIGFCAAPYYLLAARGICGMSSRWVAPIWVTAIVAFSLVSLRANYSMPYKENYRDALWDLAASYRPDDCVAFLPYDELPLQWSIYQGDAKRLRVITPEQIGTGTVAGGPCLRIWAVSYQRHPDAVEESDAREALLGSFFRRGTVAQYHWVRVTEYVQKRR